MTVLLHDVNRPMEQRIVQEIFTVLPGETIGIQSLGTIKGSFGDLAAFRVRAV